MTNKNRLHVILTFGGRSNEHNVSVVSASNVIQHFDPEKYNLKLLYITKEGQWILCDKSKFKTNCDFSEQILPTITGVPVFFPMGKGDLGHLITQDTGEHVKVDLVYIDPPFASGADYAKKVYIRKNPKLAEKINEAEQEMEIAAQDIEAFLSTQPDLIDETNVELLTEASDIAAGEAIYKLQCVVCHGQFGEGTVGPNFTDEYWVHGGDIKDLFRTIKYGVPEKGMISWSSQLRATEMQQVASFILTFQGTDPPNQKDPEGELWTAPAVEENFCPCNADILNENNSVPGLFCINA